MQRFRFLAVFSIVFPLIGSAVMMAVGAIKTVKSVQILFFGGTLYSEETLPRNLDYLDQTMIAVVESVDAFLIALAMLIFALGVYSLFIGELNVPGEWLRVRTIERLKQVLMEVVLVVLAVLFLRGLFLYEDLPWRLLVIPAAVALFALSVRLVGWSSETEH